MRETIPDLRVSNQHRTGVDLDPASLAHVQHLTKRYDSPFFREINCLVRHARLREPIWAVHRWLSRL